MTKRIIDANLNRLREGIRVVEDISRYVYEDQDISSRLKALRHKTQIDIPSSILLQNRDIQNDPCKKTTKSESLRSSLQDIITANFKRAQEASRVLEEVLKLEFVQYSQIFKEIRYELYDIDKSYTLKYQAQSL